MRDAWFLVGMATLAAITHSLVPDHWVPYVVVARAHHWSRRRTIGMAAIGAAAHLVSTGAVGLVLGLFYQGVLGRGKMVEDLTGLLVVGIGAWFLLRGLARARSGRTHGDFCGHGERHRTGRPDSFLLGAVFGLRPCVEALPIFLMAAAKGFAVAAAAILGWAAASILGMIAVVYIGRAQLERLRLGWLEAYAEALAGLTIVIVGLGVLLFGFI